jgi:hypothetical protein
MGELQDPPSFSVTTCDTFLPSRTLDQIKTIGLLIPVQFDLELDFWLGVVTFELGSELFYFGIKRRQNLANVTLIEIVIVPVREVSD